MEGISSEMEACKSPSVEPSEITRVLARLQNEINWQFLQPYSKTDRENFFIRLWNFLLFTAAHTNTSVRLAAYRTTGAFLLKVTPYYPNEIMKTFSIITISSTIDLKSSAIIASSFAFISNFTASPYLNDFLRRTPVFHHFSISDPIFSEHLSQIIRNLGRLGTDWLCTLLHCFLKQVINSNDRYLILSITEIVKHDPLKLMNELLIFIREQSKLEDNLGLISYLFSSIECNFDTIDLGDVVEAAITILSNITKSTPMEIDSAFQILSINSPSFSVLIEKVDTSNSDQQIESTSEKLSQMVKLTAKYNDKVLSTSFDIVPHLTRPSFYLLPLPLDLLVPTSSDGILQLTSKFKTMAKMINRIFSTNLNDKSKEEIQYMFGQFMSFLSLSYNDMTSACMQGFAICLPSLLQHFKEECSVVNLTKHVIFTKPVSWFHSSDILRIIKAIPFNFYSSYRKSDAIPNPPFKTENVIDILVDFSMNTNEKLYKQSIKVLSRIIINTDFTKETFYIAKKILFFDNFQLGRILSILAAAAESFEYYSTIPDETLPRNSKNHPRRLKERRMSSTTFIHYYFYDCEKNRSKASSLAHLQYVVLTLLENLSDFQDDAELFIIILNFLSCFDLSFADIHLLRPCFLDAFAIVHASLSLLTGLQWDSRLDQQRLNKAIQMIENDMKSMNYDIISETAMDYAHFLAPFAASLKFVYALPTKIVQIKFIINLFNRTLNLFPYQSAMFALKYWDDFSSINKNEILLRVYPTLEFVQDYSTASIWCHLYLSLEFNDNETDVQQQQLEPCVKILHRIAAYAIEQNEFYCEFYAFELFIAEDESISTKIDSLSSEHKAKLNGYLLQNQPNLLHKLKHEPLPEVQKHKRLSFHAHNESVTEIVDAPPNSEHDNNENEDNIYLDELDSGDVQPSSEFISDNFAELKIDYHEKQINEMLTMNLVDSDIKNPIIKTQLKQKTFSFTIDQINRLVHFFIHNNDITGLNILIKYAFSQKLLISIKGLMFPSEIIPLLFRYLKKLSSPELDDLVEFYNDSGSADIQLECKAMKGDKYFDEIKEIPKLRKVEIAAFSRTINRISYKQSDIFELCFQLLDSCKSIRRAEYVLNLINVVLSRSPMIDQAFIDSFIDLLMSKFEFIPGTQVSFCFSTIASKKQYFNASSSAYESISSHSGFIKTVKKFYPKCEPKSTSLLRLHRAILGSSDSLNENHSSIVLAVLKSDIPSMIASGASYILEILKMQSTTTKSQSNSLPEAQILNLLKTSIPLLLEPLAIRKVDNSVDANANLNNNSSASFTSQNLSLTSSNQIPNCESPLVSQPKQESNLHLELSPSQPFSSTMSNIPYVPSYNNPNTALNSLYLLTSFREDFPIAEDIGNTLTYILSQQIYQNAYIPFINDIAAIITSHELASFTSLSGCLPRLISMCSENNDDLKRLYLITDSLMTVPGNSFLFRIYLKSISEKASKIDNQRQSESFISDYITSWMQNCKNYDNYEMSMMVYSWEDFICTYYGLEQFLSMVFYQFFKYMPRFFPLFVGYAKFIQFFMRTANRRDVDMINEAVNGVALQVPNRCHALSLLLLQEKGFMKIALNLASFPKDCHESDAIIKSDPMFGQKLEQVRGKY